MQLSYELLEKRYNKVVEENEDKANKIYLLNRDIRRLKQDLRKASKNDKRDPKTGRFVKVKD